MNLLEALAQEAILLDVKAADKDSLLRELADRGAELGWFSDREALVRLLLEREDMGTTGIGKGIAVPHVRTQMVSDLKLMFARCPRGIEYQAVDGRPVSFVFLVLAPPEQNELYLKMMARISRLMRTEHVRRAILGAASAQDVLDAFAPREGV